MRRMNGGGIRPLVTVAAATAALLLPLSACGGDEQDSNSSPQSTSEPDDKEESSPSPTATATPSMPPLPAAAREQSKEGAKAFAKYYITLWHWSEQHGSFDKIESYIAASCETCKPMRGPSSGRYTAGGELKILNSFAGESFEDNHWNTSVTFSFLAGTWVANTPGATPEEKEIQDAVAQMRLEYEGGTWQVTEVTFDA